jgi:hypothetical protein
MPCFLCSGKVMVMVTVSMSHPSKRFVVEKVASPLAILDADTSGRRLVLIGSCRTLSMV